MKLVIEADGGSRGNPGIAGSGTVIYEADGTTVVRKLAYVVGTATNNVAEYHALYNGLCVAQQLGATDISVRMDSKLVVEQMSGRWKIKHPDMRELALKCQKILRTLHSAEFTWVPRRQNAAADDIPTAIIASPLARCQQTAQTVADLLNLPVNTEPGLVELDFGQWDGLTFAQANAADPKLHARWLLDPTLPAPGGESLAQAHERVTAARKRLQERYQGCTILVVSHVTPIKSILGQALDAAANIYHRLHLDLASLSIAEFYADGPTCVRLVNDTSYLKVQST